MQLIINIHDWGVGDFEFKYIVVDSHNYYYKSYQLMGCDHELTDEFVYELIRKNDCAADRLGSHISSLDIYLDSLGYKTAMSTLEYILPETWGKHPEGGWRNTSMDMEGFLNEALRHGTLLLDAHPVDWPLITLVTGNY